MKPEKIKKDFPIFEQKEELTYLDNAATSQKPEKVTKAIREFYEKHNSNIGRGIYKLANQSTQRYEDARRTIADFINAEKDEIIFVRNTTEAENLLASTLDFEGNIVLAEMAHHSEQLPWREKAERENKEIKYLETEDGKISVRDAEKKIDNDIDIVAISHISNVFGAENPVEEIIQIAHKNNAKVILDCAQSAPHTKINAKELDADFITFSGHKMLGPTGIGVLYGKKTLLKNIEPYQVGGGMVKSVQKNSVNYEDPPKRFEAGTPNIAGAIGLQAAINYLENIGMDKIEEHTKEISEKIYDGIQDIEGINILSPKDSTIISFTFETVHPHDVSEILNQNNIAIRAGNHCAQPQHEQLDINGTARISPYIYNTKKDVEKLCNALNETSEVFNTDV